MDNLPFYVLAALGFGFVIFIHELGHFLFAKWAGVKVEVFSIGFGPRILTWRWGETEYSLSLLPLGGYVRMVGQEDLPEDGSPLSTDPRSFTSATPAWRAAILLGGVLFNFISSYALMLILAFTGLPVIRPIVGDVVAEISVAGVPTPSPAARLGVRLGDEIQSVNGERTRSFDEVVMAMLANGNAPIELTVKRQGELLRLGAGAGIQPIRDSRSGLPTMGIQFARSTHLADLTTLGWTGSLPTGAPLPGERLAAVAGTQPANQTGEELERLLLPFYGQEVALTLADAANATRQTTITATGTSDGREATLGLPVVIHRVVADSAAAQAGLQSGDVISLVNETPLAGVQHFLALIRTGLDRGGRNQIGVEVGVLTSGRLPVLAPALDGKPSALAAAGVHPGDILLTTVTEAPDRVRAVLLADGDAIVIPLVAATKTRLLESHAPGRLARLLGDRERPALLEQLAGNQVVAVTDAAGKPVGSPAPGQIIIKTPDGVERTVDLRPLGEATAPFIAQLKADDWIGNLSPMGDGVVLVRNATTLAKAVALTGRQVGVPVVFETGMTPYQLESPMEAFAIANKATHTMIVKSFQLIPRFFQSAESGGVDASKSLQGPIGIFSELKRNAEDFGLAAYLKMVAFIGLNLVLVNLLPIPITDGGQLVFLAIETATGRTIPGKVRLYLAWAGLALVLSLMLFVTFLDISRRL